MNKILAIVLFPLNWVCLYIYRIVWVDFILSIFESICSMFVNPLAGIIKLITLPFILIVDIPVGLFVTLLGAFDMSINIFNNDIDISSAIKYYFKKN